VLTLTELVHEPKFSVKSALSRGHMTLSQSDEQAGNASGLKQPQRGQFKARIRSGKELPLYYKVQ